MPATNCSTTRQVFICMQDSMKLTEGRTVFSVEDRGLATAHAGLVTEVYATLSAELLTRVLSLRWAILLGH